MARGTSVGWPKLELDKGAFESRLLCDAQQMML